MDPRDFLLNTDYPMDKVIYSVKYNVTLGSFATDYKNIAHGLPFTPLVVGQWSTFSDFRVAYAINTAPTVGLNRTFDTMIDANATNVQMTTQNRTSSTATVYYRIFAFMPSDVNAVVAPTNTQADTFVLNLDHNYMKLHSSGILTLTQGQTRTVTHGLGYYPKVMTWHTDGGSTRPLYLNYPDDPIGILCRTTTTQVAYTNKNSFGGTVTLHYRIYADEA